MNTVYPRQLWLLTVNHLTPPPNISQEDLALDPLAVLRCDDRVFRTAPLLSILLYMLKACLAASRSRLCQYLQDQPPPGANTSLAETEREELKNSLVLTQESAAIQILLETCQPGVDEEGERGSLSALQETRSRQHPCFDWCTTKSHASEHWTNKKRWTQQKRREVGEVSHEVRMRVPEGENANLQGQGKWTGGGGR